MLIATTVGLAGCGGGSDGGEGTIALLLPNEEEERYETHDRPAFEAKVEDLCGDCKILYTNAKGSAPRQREQAAAALDRGADVLVVAAVHTALAAGLVKKANAQKVPVLAYDRLIENSKVDYYVSFDPEEVGELQGEALSEKVKENGRPHGPIVMLDSNARGAGARDYGARTMLLNGGIKIAKEYHPYFSSPKKAEGQVRRAIATLGKNGFAGVYATTDEIAGGVIAALESANIDPKKRPTTGEDATLAGVRRILTGEQYMTVYEPFNEEARVAAEIAVELANGDEVPSSRFSDEPPNGFRDVPAVLLEPITVTKRNVKATVIADRFISPEELCEGVYAQACREAGIS
jgi:D-xylose transport system substrate-binding protein